MARIASATLRPCDTRTSTCRSLATISSGLCPFFAISVLLRFEPIPQDGPLRRGRISMTSRHRLNRGGHRQANAALHRVVVVRMRAHQPTVDYVRRRTAEGKGKREIIRCLKRFVAREIFGYLCRAPRA